VYTDPRVVEFVNRHFVPVRAHVKDNPAAFKALGDRFNAHWTPTILIADSTGAERHRIEGFLPADDFLGQLALGVAKAAFARQDYATAERLYRDVVERFPDTDAAAEAQYWAGVSRYRATNDAAALKATAQAFTQRYQDSTWAKKASVWT
jgi:Thioredoxin-related protein